MTTPICPPDLSSRPHTLTVERTMTTPPDRLFRAWTQQFVRGVRRLGCLAGNLPRSMLAFQNAAFASVG